MEIPIYTMIYHQPGTNCCQVMAETRPLKVGFVGPDLGKSCGQAWNHMKPSLFYL